MMVGVVVVVIGWVVVEGEASSSLTLTLQSSRVSRVQIRCCMICNLHS